MTYTLREIRDSLADKGANPFRSGTPIYRLFEESKATNTESNAPMSGYLNSAILGALLGPHEVNNPFTGAPMVTRSRYDELEKRLQKVIAHNDKLTEQLNLAQEERRVLVDANGKLYDEARKSSSKVDTMYKATNQLAELCTALIRTLK